MTNYGPFTKFKYWLAEINYNAISDTLLKNPNHPRGKEMQKNLRRYLEHKSPFGG